MNRLGVAIEELLGPTGLAGRQLAGTITGVAARTAEVLVAEIGTNVSVFPTARHLASWARGCPGNDQPAGKRRSGRTRRGSKWLGIALHEAALAAIRVKTSYLAAQYQPPQTAPRARSRPRRRQALDPDRLLAHAQTGETNHDLGADYFQKRDPERATKRLGAKLAALGHQVTLQAAA